MCLIKMKKVRKVLLILTIRAGNPKIKFGSNMEESLARTPIKEPFLEARYSFKNSSDANRKSKTIVS